MLDHRWISDCEAPRSVYEAATSFCDWERIFAAAIALLASSESRGSSTFVTSPVAAAGAIVPG